MDEQDKIRLRKHLHARRAAMIRERDPFMPRWAELAEYVDPTRGRFADGDDRVKAAKRSYRKVINSMATRGLRKMTAGFMSGHTSKSRPWFRITVSDPDLAQQPDVKAWCDDVGQLIRDTLAKSNFYTALPSFYTERHLFGIGAMACVEDDREVVRFHAFTVGEYAIGIDQRSIANAFYRKYQLSAYQIRDKFAAGLGGVEKLPQKVQDALNGSRGDDYFTIESLVEPNPEARPGVQGKQHKAYRVVDWMGDEILDVQSDYECPILASRWDAISGQVYSTSPGLDALGDIKQLQYQEGVKLKLGDKIADPPLGLPDSMRNQRASLAPASVTYLSQTETGAKAQVLYSPDANAITVVMSDIERVEQRINETFYIDLFQMLAFLDDRERTATEIAARNEEKIVMLAPSLEALTDEVLDPAISRLYGLLDRRGMIPDAPESMQGANVNIEYTSMLAQAQKASGISTIDRTIGFIGSLFQVTQDPSVWDKVNLDETIDIYADQLGAPARVIRGDDEVAALRESRQQEQQMAQMAQMAPAMKQGADAISKLAETAPVDGSIAENMVA